MKNVITLFCLSTLILISSGLFAQKKCKPRYTHTDDFTEVTTEHWGSTLTSMPYYSLNVKYTPWMFVYKENGENKIRVVLDVDGKLNNDMVLNNQTWFEEGSKFMFKLENELLTFEVEKSGVRQSGGTEAEVISSITEEQINKLINQRIEKGRVYPFIDNEDMIFSFKVAKGRDKAISAQLSCFLNQ